LGEIEPETCGRENITEGGISDGSAVIEKREGAFLNYKCKA